MAIDTKTVTHALLSHYYKGWSTDHIHVTVLFTTVWYGTWHTLMLSLTTFTENVSQNFVVFAAALWSFFKADRWCHAPLLVPGQLQQMFNCVNILTFKISKLQHLNSRVNFNAECFFYFFRFKAAV